MGSFRIKYDVLESETYNREELGEDGHEEYLPDVDGIDALVAAFDELREMGYYTRHVFWCCGNCAIHGIPKEHSEKFVYYHLQDAEGLCSIYRGCYLGWAGGGEEIVRVLEKHGIAVRWDGSADKRIHINLSAFFKKRE